MDSDSDSDLDSFPHKGEITWHRRKIVHDKYQLRTLISAKFRNFISLQTRNCVVYGHCWQHYAIVQASGDSRHSHSYQDKDDSLQPPSTLYIKCNERNIFYFESEIKPYAKIYTNYAWKCRFLGIYTCIMSRISKFRDDQPWQVTRDEIKRIPTVCFSDGTSWPH